MKSVTLSAFLISERKVLPYQLISEQSGTDPSEQSVTLSGGKIRCYLISERKVLPYQVERLGVKSVTLSAFQFGSERRNEWE